MTDSITQPRPGKRERLLAAARSTFYEQGIERTTIADIASVADVPMGNVYYYFKTKAELVAAVIDLYKTSYESMIASVERRRTPKARLRALVAEWVDRRENLAAHGCPIGTLCTELSKQADLLGPDAAAILTRLLGWIEEQFRAMGRKDAAELAIALLASYEGIAVLADALNNPSLIRAEGHRLERWIDSLA
ncbi:MAG TPA: TetR/AcrR family transcriptional regulator [Pseudonocardiaceae bacterium]|jgi:AcrR family transcriptional regulator